MHQPIGTEFFDPDDDKKEPALPLIGIVAIGAFLFVLVLVAFA